MFTGAGISTSAGVPDYSSTDKTILENGPGKNHADNHASRLSSVKGFIKKQNKKGYKLVEYHKAKPTYGHRALKTLVD